MNKLKQDVVISKVTSKGQITIPRQVRLVLGLKQGDEVRFIRLDDGHYAIEASSRDIQELKGILPKPKKSVTLEEMEETIKEKRGGKQ